MPPNVQMVSENTIRILDIPQTFVRIRMGGRHILIYIHIKSYMQTIIYIITHLFICLYVNGEHPKPLKYNLNWEKYVIDWDIMTTHSNLSAFEFSESFWHQNITFFDALRVQRLVKHSIQIQTIFHRHTDGVTEVVMI